LSGWYNTSWITKRDANFASCIALDCLGDPPGFTQVRRTAAVKEPAVLADFFMVIFSCLLYSIYDKVNPEE
jgi:hypothetical protein